ncbi:MAG: hypothetical protein K0R43_2644 [Pseudoduganella sp.]|jgi:hypothetical protein|nr:hypothetical protein [Pseudoduganella sp.]
MTTTNETVQGLYLAYLQRPADPRGLEFWSDALRTGITHNLSGEFAKSPEFRATFGGKSHAETVDALYLNLFGRRADEAGMKLYKGMLDTGKATVESVAGDILQGAIGSDRETLLNKVAAAELFTTTLRIEAAYSWDLRFDPRATRDYIASVTDDASAYAALGKLPDLLQLGAVLSGDMKQGAPAPADEVPPVTLTNEDRVQELHLAYFGRPAKVDELRGLGEVIAKSSYEAVSLLLSQSREYTDSVQGLSHQQVVDKLYMNLFGRHGDEAGLKFYADALASGKAGIDFVVRGFLDNAHGNDWTVLENRLVGAEIFTTALKIDPLASSAYAVYTLPGQAYVDLITTDASVYDAMRGLPKSLQDLVTLMQTPFELAQLTGVVPVDPGLFGC